ncbi:MAG: glycosyl hydrolase family 18 protein [Lachnospiraceae bacterium]|uniref:Chitinase n=2 Tax=Hominifimenecus microfluidus TaxID=2885348 RepID=A0AAE3JEB8_9FIRM|nr:chitinase [Hominifimenecus microfluidus]
MGAKQNKKLPVLIVIILIVLVLAVSFIYERLHADTPTDKMADLNDIYQSEDGTAAVIANGVLSEARAEWRGQTAYLNLGIVRDELNDHFYWDDNEKLLLYTTANEVVRADAESTYQGVPVFFEQGKNDAAESRVYISLDYVSCYTNMQVETYSAPSRVFLRTIYGESEYADVAEETAVHSKANVKSPLLVKASAGSRLWVIREEGSDWLYVYVGGEDGGVVGYVQRKLVSNLETVDDAGPYQQPEYTHLSLSEPIRMVWHQVFQESGLDAWDSLMENVSGVNVLAPTWFSIVDSEGTVESRANQEYVDRAHANGMQIWALVENINSEVKLDNARLLNTTSSRNRIIQTLIEQALAYGIDGLNVDLEGLPSSAGSGYIQFIRELSVECRKNGLILSVDNYVPSAWTTHYQRDKQAEVIDYLVIMAYDEHYNGSEAGSTASFPFVENGIANTIAQGVPADRIICAVPFYSRIWHGDGSSVSSETISMPNMQAYIAEHELTPVWEDDIAQNYVEYTDEEGTLNRIWVEDASSLQAKIDVIRNYSLAGVAGWKLGMETSDVWSILAGE